MSDIKAPPLGQLDSGQLDDLLDSVDLPSPQITPAKPQGVPSPRIPIPDTMDFSKVTGDAGKAINNYVPPQDRPKPFGLSVQSSSGGYAGDITQRLTADESVPFNYTGKGAGSNMQELLQVNPVDALPRPQSELGTYVSNPLNTPGNSDVVVANGTPVNQFQYTEGLTASQLNSRDFFNGLQDWRKQIAPSMLPALLYTPQQLSPGVAGGFSPTAETKGPYSWLVGDPTENINPLAGDWGASGQGLLGGLGWVMGRLSPTTYLKGIAMDVARSVAAGYEGGSAGLSALLKGGNFGDAFVNAASENYYANAPQVRGLPVKSIFGSRDLGDMFTQSYTLSALSGANDTSFSGQGNNTLFTDGSNRNLVNQGESFNPFGFRDPFRSSFKTGALEAQERSKGAWFGHGYDQWAQGIAGLGADIFLEGRIDQVVQKALGKTLAKTAKAVPTPTRTSAPTSNLAGVRQVTPSANVTPPRFIPNLQLPPARFDTQKGIQETFINTMNRGPQKALSPAKPRALPPAKVYQGELVVTPEEVARDTARRLQQDRPRLQPVEQRFLPPGKDPFVVPETPRVYSPKNDDLPDVSFESGGAIVPWSVRSIGIDTSEGGKIVPAVLGVGGKPGGIPINPRVENGRVFIASSAEPVTVWDRNLGQFVSSGGDGIVNVERVLKAPGKVGVPDTPKPKNIAPVEPPSGLIEGSIVPVVVPKNTPNFTVKPTLALPPAILGSHSLDMTTGVFKQNYTIPQKTGLGEVFTPPKPEVVSVAAESLAPAASSADLVRSMLNESSEVYNPALLSREPRDINSMAVLAQTVLLPNGVRILDEVSAKDITAFHQLSKKVESAIIASGLDPQGIEASSIRRMFDRSGPQVPNNLKTGEFAVEVAPRTLDTPTSYVKPSPQVLEPDTSWSPRAASNLTPRSSGTLGSTTDSAKSSDYMLGVTKSDGSSVPIPRESVLDVPVVDRKVLVGKSVQDGFEVSSDAVSDVISPNVTKDIEAAKSYATANLPKESQPIRMDSDTLSELNKHQQLTQELSYTNELITDVTTQLADVETQLNKYLEKIDELPDIGVYPLVDEVPLSPLTKDIIMPKLSDVEDLYVNPETLRRVYNTVPIGVFSDDGQSIDVLAGVVGNASNGRPPVTLITREQIPYAMLQVDEFNDDFGHLIDDVVRTPKVVDLDLLDATVMPDLPDQELLDMFREGAFMTPVIKKTGGTLMDPIYTVISGERYVAAYKRVKYLDDSTVDRMSVTILQDSSDSLSYGTAIKLKDGTTNKVSDYIYHSTVGGELRFVGKDDLSKFTTLSKSDFDDYVERGSLSIDKTSTPAKPSNTPDSTGYTPNVTEFTISGKNDPLAFSNSGIAKNTGEVYQYLGKTSDGSLAVVGKNDPYSFRLLDKGDLDDYIKQGIVATSAKQVVEAPKFDTNALYHGTRVSNLMLDSVDPVVGATRSEYGLGVWLTKDQDIAVAASGRAVPNNSVPLAGREFTDGSFVHEVGSYILSEMKIVRATDTIKPNLLRSLPISESVFKGVVPYPAELSKELIDVLSDTKLTYGQLFDKVDETVRKVAQDVIAANPDEYELTYVQRIVTDILRNEGVDGITNGVNTAVYRTENLFTNRVHDVSDLVGDSSNGVTLALHEVNLLQRSLDAAPDSKLLQVQLAEAKATAASRVRDSLAGELTQLTSEQTKLVSRLLDQDEVLADVAKTQRSQEVIKAVTKDERTLESFNKELNKEWNSPCL